MGIGYEVDVFVGDVVLGNVYLVELVVEHVYEIKPLPQALAATFSCSA